MPLLYTLCPFSCQTIQCRNCPTQNGANKNSGSDVFLIIFFFLKKNLKCPGEPLRRTLHYPFNHAYIWWSNKLPYVVLFFCFRRGVKLSRLMIERPGRQMAYFLRGASGLRMRFVNSSVGSLEGTWWAWCYGNLG